MHVLIFDADFRGHHLKYASMIIDAYVGCGWRVSYAAPLDAFSSEEYQELLLPLTGKYVELPFELASQGYRSKVLEATVHTVRLIESIRRSKPDVVVIPHLDLCFYVYGILGSCMRFLWLKRPIITGIQFAAVWAYKEADLNAAKKLKKWIALYVVNAGPFSRILCIDQNAYQWFAQARRLRCVDVAPCPDPVESDISASWEECRDHFGVPRQSRVVCSVGVLDKRKGADILIKAFSRLRVNADQRLLLVGKQKPAVRHVVESVLKARPEIADRIIQVDRFVSTSELQMAIKASDVVCALYPGQYGSASIVLRAAAARRPVLGSDNGWIGRVVRQYEMGRVCNVCELSEVCLGLEWAFSKPSVDMSRSVELASSNSTALFKQKVKWLVEKNGGIR